MSTFFRLRHLYNFYIQLAKGFSKDGHEATVSDLERTLPILSRRGSQDDMSVAGIYDERCLNLMPQLLKWQVNRIESKITAVSTNIAHTWHNIIVGAFNTTDREMAYIDLSRLVKEKNELKRRQKIIMDS